jgi:hypothetical protein
VEDKFLNNLSTRVTFGERLSADCNVDLVTPSPTGEFELVVHNTGKTVIVPKFEHDGVIYIPPKLHPGVHSAIWFPAGITAVIVHLAGAAGSLCPHCHLMGFCWLGA